MKVHISVHGIGDVAAAVKDLEDRLKKKVLLEAYKKASKPLIAAAKSLVPVGDTAYKDRKGRWKHINLPYKRYRNGKVVATYMPENLKKSIGFFQPRRKRSNSIVAYVGPKSGRGKYDGYYGHMVEFGTKYMRAQPYLRPAYERTKVVVKASISLQVLAAIKKYRRR